MACSFGEEQWLISSGGQRKYGTTSSCTTKPKRLIQYDVQENDTLQGIALKFNVTVSWRRRHLSASVSARSVSLSGFGSDGAVAGRSWAVGGARVSRSVPTSADGTGTGRCTEAELTIPASCRGSFGLFA